MNKIQTAKYLVHNLIVFIKNEQGKIMNVESDWNNLPGISSAVVDKKW